MPIRRSDRSRADPPSGSRPPGDATSARSPLRRALAAALAVVVVASALVGGVPLPASAAAPTPSKAVAFTAGPTVALPGAAAGDTVVEVAFNDDLDGGGNAPTADDFRVKVGPRLLDSSAFAVGGTGDGDAQVLLNLGTVVDPWNVSRVNVTETADFESTGGDAVDPTAGRPLNRSVVGTGETVEAGGNSWFRPATATRPSTVAVVTDDLDTDLTVNSTVEGFVASRSTGTGSQVHVLDTGGRPANERLSVAFDGGDDAFLRYRQLDLSIRPRAVFIDGDEPLAATVRSNVAGRTVRVIATSSDDDVDRLGHVVDQ